MIPLILLLLVSVVFQITTNWVALGDELNKNSIDGLMFAKRNLAALVKNYRIPIQQRGYLIPPMVSPYGKDQKGYLDEHDSKEKRYLGSLVKSGDINFGRQQRKKSGTELKTDELDEFRFPNQEELPNSTNMKLEMISNLKPIILQYLNEFKKKYDPRKVDLFLENLANAIYDQNEEISMDEIKALVHSDYFQPEENSEPRKNELLKRNIQSLARDLNVSYSGITHGEPQMRQIRVPLSYSYHQYEALKRNLGSVIKNKLFKRYLGTMAKNHNFPIRVGSGKREATEESPEYSNENNAPYGYDNDADEYFRSLDKRHTMYDINEPDITFEYPSQVGEQNDYNDYAEQMGQDATIPIGKRYIVGTSRHGRMFLGWMPGQQGRRERMCKQDKRQTC